MSVIAQNVSWRRVENGPLPSISSLSCNGVRAAATQASLTSVRGEILAAKPDGKLC